jgi:uncharacterized protein YndB with AHSA1/START domain
MAEVKNVSVNGMKDQFVLITRTFRAPRTLVFRAWTDPEYLKRWFAPSGCSIEFSWIDVREGGGFLSCINTPGAHECWCLGFYQEIVSPERIVYTLTIADKHGNPVSALSAGMDPEWPAKTTVTVTFAEQDGETTIHLHQTAMESIAKRTGAHPSWLQMLDILDSVLHS